MPQLHIYAITFAWAQSRECFPEIVAILDHSGTQYRRGGVMVPEGLQATLFGAASCTEYKSSKLQFSRKLTNIEIICDEMGLRSVIRAKVRQI
jgi:hypothetical protein